MVKVITSQQIKTPVMHSTANGSISDISDNITNVETKQVG